MMTFWEKAVQLWPLLLAKGVLEITYLSYY